MQFELTTDDADDATEPVAPGTSCSTGGGHCEWTGTTWICYDPQ